MEFIYQSETIGKITDAMLKLQPDVPEFMKEGSTDPKAKRFATVKVDVFLHELRPLCLKHNILLKPDLVYSDGNQFLKVQVIEKSSSEFFATYIYLFPICDANGNNQQDLGKIITYQFKNALRILFALVTNEEDFDQPNTPTEHNNANKEPVKTFAAPKKEYPKDTSGKYIDQDQNKELFRLSGYNKDNMKILRDQLGGVVHSEKILAEDFDKAVDMLAVITVAKPDKTKEKVDMIKKSFPKAELVDELPF